MKPVSAQDYYQCKRCYGASSMDLASLTDFYLPLIGVDAFGIYQALNREDEATHVHEELMAWLGLTPGEFEKALMALEAVGLVRTFIAKESATELFVYCLYAPLHAQEFDKDIMLSGTLKGKFGMEAYERLRKRHEGQKAVEDMEEVSVSFPEYFKPSFDAKFYLASMEKEPSSIGKALARTGFDAVSFQRVLEAKGLRKNALSEEELGKVEQISTLYSIGLDLLSDLVMDSLRPNAPQGRKLDVESLSALCYKASFVPSLQDDPGESSNVQSDTETARMIKLMDEMAPAAFLKLMQKNHNPAKVDLKLLEHLRLGLGLPNPCVNALVFYVLAKRDNTLPAPYCEKLAAALVREGCRTARDAMDYFSRTGRRRKKTPEQPSPAMPSLRAEQKKAAPAPSVTDEEVSDEAVEEALKELFGD